MTEVFSSLPCFPLLLDSFVSFLLLLISLFISYLTDAPMLPPRMIAIFDEDGGGDVDFQEFVSGLSAFSSKGNKEEKLRFAFKVYDIDRDGYISNGELFIVLKMMVGSNLKDMQLQQIVDKTIMEADLDGDGKISFEEFTRMVESTDVSLSMTLGKPFSFPPTSIR